MTPGGPHDILPGLRVGQHESMSINRCKTGLRIINVVEAVMPFSAIVDSLETNAVPLGTLRLPTVAATGLTAVEWESPSILLTSWSNQAPCAVSYQICQVLGSDIIPLATISGTSYSWWPVSPMPHFRMNGTEYDFKVRAINAEGLVSDPATVSIIYQSQNTTGGGTSMLACRLARKR